jgi:von Willebrand factor type A domain
MKNNISPYNFILSSPKRFFSQMLILSGVVLLAFSIFSWITEGDKQERGVLFIVDTSLSMSVEDIVSENNILTSRLSVARDLLRSVNIWSSRALMTFASSAKLQLPLSTDDKIWKEVIDAIDVVRYGSPTDIETALASAILVYGNAPLDIYILTDGERTSEWESLTGVILPEDISLHLIGIGTTEGGKIVNNYDGDGRIVYKKYDWKEILSRLDKNYLQSLSKKYNTSLEYIENTSDIESIRTSIHWVATDEKILFNLDILYILSSLLILMGMMMYDYRLR